MFGRDKRTKLDTRRREVLTSIRQERWLFEKMLQRAEIAADAPTSPVLIGVPERLLDVERKASQATDIEELDDLGNVAQGQGRFEFICVRARKYRTKGHSLSM